MAVLAPTLLKTSIPRWQDLARLGEEELAGVDLNGTDFLGLATIE